MLNEEAGAPAVIVLRGFSFFQYIFLPALAMMICTYAGIDRDKLIAERKISLLLQRRAKYIYTITGIKMKQTLYFML